MQLLFLSLLMLQSSIVTAKLYFKIQSSGEGTIEPNPKDKNVWSLVCEDSFHTTPYGFAVADGVGKQSFPTAYFAQALTNRIASAFLKSQDREFPMSEFNSFVSKNLVREFENYNSQLSLAREQKLQEINAKKGNHFRSAFSAF